MINRILIDCSDAYNKPWIHTGIQRVVRNVVRHAESAQGEVKALPVVVSDNCLLPAGHLKEPD